MSGQILSLPILNYSFFLNSGGEEDTGKLGPPTVNLKIFYFLREDFRFVRDCPKLTGVPDF